MSIHVGAVVLVRSRDKWLSAKVLALSATHARCALSDGRTLWVAQEAITAAGAPMVPMPPSSPAPVPPPEAGSPGASVAAPPSPAAGPSDSPALSSPPPASSQPLPAGAIVGIYVGCLVAFGLLRGSLGLLLILPLWYVRVRWAKQSPVRAQQWWKHGLIAYLSCAGLVMGLFSFGFVRGYARAKRRAQQRQQIVSMQELNVLHRSDDCQLTAPGSWKDIQAERIEDSPFKAVLVATPDEDVAVHAAMWFADEDTVPVSVMGRKVAARLGHRTTLKESGGLDVPAKAARPRLDAGARGFTIP
jgi:hypothetical protein